MRNFYFQKNAVVFAFFLFLVIITHAQSTVLNEDFEGTLQVTPTGIPAWSVNTTLQVSGMKSYHNVVGLNSVTYFETNTLNLTNFTNVLLDFQHICKIQPQDSARLFISVDNGVTWQIIPNSAYLGAGLYNINNMAGFSSTSYLSTWLPGNSSAVPNNTWWKYEQFDVSSIAANQSQVKFRFYLKDGNSDGANQNAGWFIDDIRVIAAFSELNPPVITYLAPILQDTVYSAGPFAVNASITDASGISSAKLYYKINTLPWDSVVMASTGGSSYMGEIPPQPYNSNIQYYIIARDASPAQNVAQSSIMTFINLKPSSVFTIGNGTTVNSTSDHPTPYGTYYKNHRVQYLLRASELTALGVPQGPITAIAFDVATLNNCLSMPNFTIKMKHTTQTQFTTNFETGTYTSVWTHSNFLPVVGWNQHVFTTPFVWNGTSNIIVDICFDIIPVAFTQNASVRFTATTGQNTALFWRNDTSPACGVTTGGTVSTNRANMRITIPPNTNNYDAGIVQIAEPTGIVLTTNPVDVKVHIKNYGIQTLTSVNIGWSVNGVLQTPFLWTGALLEDVTSGVITIGNANFSVGTNQIKAWTSMPNGQTDQNFLNDTLTSSVFGCSNILNGTYTINSLLPTSGTNFQTFSAAFTALNNCGINGPVVFELHDLLYDLTVNINEFPGSSAVNTITFKPAPGKNVVITSASASSTIRLNATKNLIFDGSNDGTGGKNLTIRNTSTAANTAAIWLSSTGAGSGQGCNNITIKNCIIEAGSNSTTSTFGVYVGGTAISTTGTGNNNHNIKLQNNHIRLAYIGIYSRSASPNFNTGLNISDNQIGSTISTQYVTFRGVDLQGAINPVITSNFIHNLRVNTAVNNAAIEIGENVSGAQIIKNKIQTVYSTSASGYGAYGINIASSTGVSDILIANNFISDIVTVKYSISSTTWNPFGIRITGGTNIRVYHNSINLFGEPSTGTSASMSACLLITASVTGLDVRNNIFANSMTGNSGSKSYCVHKATTVTFANSNHNNYFPSGLFGLFGYSGSADITTLSGWKTVTTFDANSVNINPLFISSTDLHTFNPSMNNLGTPITEVPDDIDGDVRNALTPDIGADEFEPLALDIALNAILYPPAAPCGLTNNELISFRVKNMGSTPVTSFTAAYTINGSAETVESFVANILTDSLQTFVFSIPANFSAHGTYLLSVRVKLAGDPSPLNDSINGYLIRHSHNFAGSDYKMGFETVEFHHEWTVLNQDGSAFKWDVPFAGIANTGSNSARFNNGAANTGEDWMFSRCFSMQAGEAYDLSYFFRGSSTVTPASFQVFAGNSNTPAAMTILLANHPNILQTTYQKSTVRFTVPVSGTYYFGWKNNTSPSSILTYIDDVNIKLIPPQEAAMLSKVSPNDGCDLGLQPLTVKIRNNGGDTITSDLVTKYRFCIFAEKSKYEMSKM